MMFSFKVLVIVGFGEIEISGDFSGLGNVNMVIVGFGDIFVSGFV